MYGAKHKTSRIYLIRKKWMLHKERVGFFIILKIMTSLPTLLFWNVAVNLWAACIVEEVIFVVWTCFKGSKKVKNNLCLYHKCWNSSQDSWYDVCFQKHLYTIKRRLPLDYRVYYWNRSAASIWACKVMHN